MTKHAVLTALSMLIVLGGASSMCAHAQNKPKIVFVTGGDEYRSTEVLEPYAEALRQRYGFEVVYIKDTAPGADRAENHDPQPTPLPEVEEITDADLLVVFMRFRTWIPEHTEVFLEHFRRGKPAVGIRTATHAFWRDRTFSPKYLGGHYKTHYHENIVMQTNPAVADHPILRGVDPKRGDGEGPYVSTPLTEGAMPLVFSYGHNRDAPGVGSDSFDSPNFPVVWTFDDDGGRRAMITLGSYRVGDLESAYMQNLFYNSIHWALGYEVPEDGVLSAGEQYEQTPEERAYAAAPEHVPAPPRFNPEDREEWEVLFDGRDLSKWRHWDVSIPPYGIHLDRRANSEGPVDYAMSPARWKIDGPTVAARPGYGDIITKDEFTEYQLHLDYYIPESPDWVTGEWKGNSGVYLNGSYEIALLDSFGKAPTDRSNGAIYRQYAPSQNASRPAGEWQNLLVTFEDGHATVELNGTVVHDEVALNEPTFYGFPTAETFPEGSWQREEEVTSAGPIRLQAETAPVRFANIAIKRLD